MNETFEPPREFTYKNVCYWEPESKKLMVAKSDGDTSAGTLLTKARKFLELNCIVKLSQAKWECRPLKGYNKTTYTIEMINNKLECNCQGYCTKQEKGEFPICSHIVAVNQLNFIETKK